MPQRLEKPVSDAADGPGPQREYQIPRSHEPSGQRHDIVERAHTVHRTIGLSAHRGRQMRRRDTRHRRLASSEHIGQHHHISGRQDLREGVSKPSGPGVPMWLKDHHEAT